MRGVDASTGKAIDGIDHFRQSVREILTTPIGSRIMRRTFGSRLFKLIDAPTNQSLRMDLVAATADALARWEPRMRLQKVEVTMPSPGAVVLDVTGIYLPEGRVITISGIEVR